MAPAIARCRLPAKRSFADGWGERASIQERADRRIRKDRCGLDLAVDLAVLIPASVWPIYPTASSTHTGTWSEGFSQLRVNLSIPAACIRSVAKLALSRQRFREGDTNDTDVTAGWPFG
jgi:hypothetical protein